MYYVNYYSKRSRDAFRGRVARKAPRKPKTTKYPNLPWVDLVSTGKPIRPKPKSLHKALKASVKGPLTKHTHNGIQPYPENISKLERFMRMHPKLSDASVKTLDYIYEHGGRQVSLFYLQKLAHLEKAYNRLKNKRKR